jgi:hypothetical protein
MGDLSLLLVAAQELLRPLEREFLPHHLHNLLVVDLVVLIVLLPQLVQLVQMLLVLDFRAAADLLLVAAAVAVELEALEGLDRAQLQSVVLEEREFLIIFPELLCFMVAEAQGRFLDLLMLHLLQQILDWVVLDQAQPQALLEILVL